MEQTPGGLITNWNGFISLGKIDRERERRREHLLLNFHHFNPVLNFVDENSADLRSRIKLRNLADLGTRSCSL